MGTSILSTHTILLLWDVLRSLKQQRKRERLSSPPLPPTPTQVVSPSERDIEREVSAFSDWLLSQWAAIPPLTKYLTEYFTFEQAQFFAAQSFYVLLKAWGGDYSQDVSTEYDLNPRFTLLLFLDSQSLSITTRVIDRIDKTINEFPTQFKLPLPSP